MKQFETLEELYNQYDNETSPFKRKQILEKILVLDPNDLDSMHRLIDYIPDNQRFQSLLELKEKAKRIVYSKISEDEDAYSNYETRPYIFILEDILSHYEKNKDYENCYLLINEILGANEGDNLGIRFHLIAYCIGQNKISELQAFMNKCPDQYSVPCKFANLYLKQLKKKNNDKFEVLFKEMPYLYCLFSKEIDLTKNEMKNIVDKIAMYRPNGFYDCLLFYRLMLIFQTTVSKKILSALIPKFSGPLQNFSIENLIPTISKTVLYSLLDITENDYSVFIEQLSTYGKSESEWLNAKEELIKLNIIETDKDKENEKIYFGEASAALLKMFIHKDILHLTNLNCTTNWLINFKKRY